MLRSQEYNSDELTGHVQPQRIKYLVSHAVAHHDRLQGYIAICAAAAAVAISPTKSIVGPVPVTKVASNYL
jgi:uncharacterized membrane protein